MKAQKGLTEAEKVNLATLIQTYRQLKTEADREAFRYCCPAKLYPLVLERVKSKALRQVNVLVEKLAERYNGALTGSTVYHVIENGCPSGLFRGCPLGRGYTEDLALADFVMRANLDDSSLKLLVKELVVVARRS